MAVAPDSSFTKRFTSWSHVVLGLSLAGAPIGAWIAVAGQFEKPAFYLGLGVLTWTAGFDIIYALQDEAFDRRSGLHSLPARLGAPGALWISRLFHVAAILLREQWIVRDGDLSRVDEAFFTLNSQVGLIFFTGHLLERLFMVQMA